MAGLDLLKLAASESLSQPGPLVLGVAGLFPNDASALRLVSAVLMEISEDWETNRKYLTMEPG